MNHVPLPLIALVAGAAIAVQAGLNARLGVILGNPLWASAVAFVSSLMFTLAVLAIAAADLPSAESVKRAPFYLWFSGGMLSAFGIAAFYWLIPKMGVSILVSYALTGQLLFAMVAGHFGWFHLPVVPLSLTKVAGTLALVVGIVLINRS